MTTAISCTVALLAVIGYFTIGLVFFLGMLAVQELAEKSHIHPMYGIVALYRWINQKSIAGENEYAEAVTLVSPILVPLGLLELSLRLLLRRFRPTTPTTLLV